MKGILFKEHLFREVIAGRKTQTRRIAEVGKNPRYNPGEPVFLKEPYMNFDSGITEYAYRYAPDSPERNAIKWKNKMFMPQSAARHFIRMQDEPIRVERLWDISPEDCILEGVRSCFLSDVFIAWDYEKRCWLCESKAILEFAGSRVEYATDVAVKSYFSLWRSINGTASFEANPMVFVYDFDFLPPFGQV